MLLLALCFASDRWPTAPTIALRRDTTTLRAAAAAAAAHSVAAAVAVAGSEAILLRLPCYCVQYISQAAHVTRAIQGYGGSKGKISPDGIK